MSTIVVVKKNGIAAIGADTLNSFGSIKMSAECLKNHTKLLEIGSSTLALVGDASWTTILTHYFRKKKRKPAFRNPQEIFDVSLELHGALKESYFIRPEEEEDDEFESSHLDCLIANKHGIFGLHSMRSVDEYERFFAFGSGYRFALGAMHAVYDRFETAEEIAVAGLEAGAEFDDSSSLPYEVRTMRCRD